MKVTLQYSFVLVLVLMVQLSFEKNSFYCNSFADGSGETKPLYVLSLVPNSGNALLSGHRIAQREINNRTDLLAGYHIELIVDTFQSCSSSEAGSLGLSSLLKYTLNPPCRPVVAVAGLGCTSHTSLVSSVAGHDGFDLIQLSSANSPVFDEDNHHFPHLWRFLGSADVYNDAILALMNQFNWKRVGIIYNTGLRYHLQTAKSLEKKIRNSNNKSLTFILGIRGRSKFYIDMAISKIKNTKTTILVSILRISQSRALLSETLHHQLNYPNYIWIHVEEMQRDLLSSGWKDVIKNATLGHIYLYTRTQINKEETLVSGKPFDTFNRSLYKERTMYNSNELSFPFLFAHNWYDQIWALALAVNNSLPILKNRNLSIDNYTIGQNGITAVIEEQMSKLSFQGAGGWVEFNQYRGVSTPVEIYWILEDGNQTCVGIYNPLDVANFHVSINASNLPNATLYRTYEFILIPHLVTILLYILTGAVMLFTTIQLTVYIYFKEHKVIKATSPYLSLLMFGGFYLFFSFSLAINYSKQLCNLSSNLFYLNASCPWTDH